MAPRTRTTNIGIKSYKPKKNENYLNNIAITCGYCMYVIGTINNTCPQCNTTMPVNMNYTKWKTRE